jgi:hypothetical protein
MNLQRVAVLGDFPQNTEKQPEREVRKNQNLINRLLKSQNLSHIAFQHLREPSPKISPPKDQDFTTNKIS